MKSRVVIEEVSCDVCGNPVGDGADQRISLGTEYWEIDLCAQHLAEMRGAFERWRNAGRRISSTRRRSIAEDEWDYLETLGFSRHRGRKTAAERAALDRR